MHTKLHMMKAFHRILHTILHTKLHTAVIMDTKMDTDTKQPATDAYGRQEPSP